MDRRSFMLGTAAAALTSPVLAQDSYPPHTITLINAFPPARA